MNIANGFHEVRLVGASHHNPGTNDEYAEFIWEMVDEPRVQFTLNLATRLSDGKVNVIGYHAAKLWATDWNGASLAWLVANAKNCASKHRTVALFNDGNIMGVKAADDEPTATTPTTAEAKDSKKTRIKLIVNEERLNELPSDIPSTGESVYSTFRHLTEGTDPLDADKVWTILAGRIGPMQLDFTEDDWAKMLAAIRNLKSCECNV